MIRLKLRTDPMTIRLPSPVPLRMKVSPAVIVYEGGSPYEGSYEVTPKVESQSLPTAGKILQKDINVLAVPFYEVDNQKGTTIFIASEV